MSMPSNVLLMNTKSSQIKPILAKIKLEKIIKYLTANPQSKTLKRIIRYSQRAWTSEDQAEVFKLAVNVAYCLDTICDPTKANYVKNEKQKQHLLNISGELFEATVGKKS